jgi:YfiH family protein
MDSFVVPKPSLSEVEYGNIPLFTDDALFEACGVRIAFTTRAGGVSSGSYGTLNLADHVADDHGAVMKNRACLMHAIAPELHRCHDEVLIVPNQVHGDTVVSIDSSDEIEHVKLEVAQGADAIIVDAREIAALLCFADCVPLIIVLPTGRFAVVHAGWRGVENTIAAKTLSLMLEQEKRASGASPHDIVAATNVYIGPYIHRECFETNEEIHDLFTTKFGDACDFDAHHIDLGAALRVQLMQRGIEPARICDLDICTVCNNDRFFSYRAQSGIAGRHGALAIRL